MKRKGWSTYAWVAAVMVGCMGVMAWAQQRGAAGGDGLPPYVVKSEPVSRATDVDVKLTEIRVTYDRPMTDGSWSWIIEGNLGAYPGAKELGEPRWEDGGKTCVLPVKLQPGTVYAVGCNSYRHTGFKDRDGRVAVPYVLVFKTK